MGCITGPIGGWERRGSHRYEAVRLVHPTGDA